MVYVWQDLSDFRCFSHGLASVVWLQLVVVGHAKFTPEVLISFKLLYDQPITF